MLDALLRKGYFPQELPPLFSTASFADYIAKNRNKLAAPYKQKKPIWTLPTYHNLARVGGLRRRLSVPNPFSFYRLVRAFDSNAKSLKTKWAVSKFSHTKPTLLAGQSRAIAPSNFDRASPRAAIRVGARYLLKADVSQFYPSIYTHTIPWAVHTKAKAKTKMNDPKLFGNVLDKEIQACQSGQTKGIAIGPDTSLGVAELILGDVDSRLSKACKISGGVRFIDDIELTFHRLADAEDALCRLEEFLYEYELQLNSSKTKIVESPCGIDSAYVSQIRPHIPDKNKAVPSQWIDFFNRAYMLAGEFPADGVLRYAVACVQDVRATSKTWKLAQTLLWQCVAGDPGCLRFVIDVLWLNAHRDNALVVDREMAENALDSLIASSAPVDHGSEVLWSIWAAMLFNLQLSDKSAALVSRMEDSYIASAAHLAHKRGVFSASPPTKVWGKWFEVDCFKDSQWLFVYESYRQGWMSSNVKRAKLQKDDSCRLMKQAGVSFIDESAIEGYRPKRFKPIIIVGGGGGY